MLTPSQRAAILTAISDIQADGTAPVTVQIGRTFGETVVHDGIIVTSAPARALEAIISECESINNGLRDQGSPVIAEVFGGGLLIS